MGAAFARVGLSFGRQARSRHRQSGPNDRLGSEAEYGGDGDNDEGEVEGMAAAGMMNEKKLPGSWDGGPNWPSPRPSTWRWSH